MFRGLLGCDSYGTPPLHCFESEVCHRGSPKVDECRSHFPPVAKLERPLAETAPCYDCYSIGGAAVDFHKRYQPLAICPVQFAERVINPEETTAQHCEANAKYLTCTKMSMRGLGLLKEAVQRFHSPMINRRFFCTNCV